MPRGPLACARRWTALELAAAHAAVTPTKGAVPAVEGGPAAARRSGSWQAAQRVPFTLADLGAKQTCHATVPRRGDPRSQTEPCLASPVADYWDGAIGAAAKGTDANGDDPKGSKPVFVLPRCYPVIGLPPPTCSNPLKRWWAQ